MKEHYIQAPLEHHEITPIEYKAKRNKPAKRKDVPNEYRKHPIKRFEDQLYNAKQDIKFIIRVLKREV